MAGKRTVPVMVRMTIEDTELFKRVAEKLWPGALMPRAAIVLSLARKAAREALKKKRER